MVKEDETFQNLFLMKLKIHSKSVFYSTKDLNASFLVG